MIRSKRFVGTAAVLAAALFFVTACGSDSDSGSNGGGEDLSGTIAISGSSTVEPISVAVAEAFAGVNGDVDVSVSGPGTGDGFKLFCEGETDITGASRTIKDEEATSCADAGIEYVELKVAFDGMAVMTNPDNDAASCLAFADLYAMIGPEAQGIEKWSDATDVASALGSSTELPDLELSVVGPGPESGTYDSLIEIALEGLGEERAEAGEISEDDAATTRSDYNASADDNAIIEGIKAAEGSLGWVGFAFAEESSGSVTELEVDGGDGCVAPTAETIADGSYPLSRGLYIYVNSAKAAESEAIKSFVEFYLGDGYNDFVTSVGYVALPDDQLEASKSAFAEIG